jgi:hypothetical protein
MKKGIILFVALAFTACSSESRNTSGSNTIVAEQNKPNPQVEKYTFQVIHQQHP